MQEGIHGMRLVWGYLDGETGISIECYCIRRNRSLEAPYSRREKLSIEIGSGASVSEKMEQT